MRYGWIGWISVASIGLVACASPPVAGDVVEVPEDPVVAEVVSAPVALDPSIQTVWAYLAERYDADGDGLVTSEEYTRDNEQFAHWDVDGDGSLSARDFEAAAGAGERRRSEGRAARSAVTDVAQEGRPAPDFQLTSLDGETTYRLADFQGQRPVALIFGSYT